MNTKLFELSKFNIVAFQQKDKPAKQPQTATQGEIDTFCTLISKGNILEAQKAAPLARQLTAPLSSQEIIKLRDNLTEFINHICVAMNVELLEHRKTEAFDYLRSHLEKVGEEVTFRVAPPNNRLYKISLEGDTISIKWQSKNKLIKIKRGDISDNIFGEHLRPIVTTLKQLNNKEHE